MAEDFDPRTMGEVDIILHCPARHGWYAHFARNGTVEVSPPIGGTAWKEAVARADGAPMRSGKP